MAQKLTTTEELSLEAHVIERVDGLIVVGLDLSCMCDPCQYCFRLGSDAKSLGVGEASSGEPRANSIARTPLVVLSPAHSKYEEGHSPSGTSSSPLSVSMISVGKRSLDQAQLDLEMSEAWGRRRVKNAQTPGEKAATVVKRK